MKKLIKEEWVLNKTIGSFIKEEVKIPDSRAEKLANLFDEGCEVAYVARYRKDVHNGMECDDIRKAFEIYKETRDLNKKVVSAVNSVVPKIENVYESQNVKDMLKACSDIGEVSEITKMYTGGGRKNKVALAKEKGYETYAQEILSGKFVDLEILSTRKAVPQDEIEENIVIIMADLLNKMESTVKAVNEM
ncbi:unnamed protein product [Caenorhabditis angaria]|uniref:Tex-like protein N-terminal domain-containing protein n=1 Tax=Caenorhabditis angaria TaxID=860376 RepID=A0A9P1MWK2_9PELO|nr:unnamed protein product [Caenorhabditis angaria]